MDSMDYTCTYIFLSDLSKKGVLEGLASFKAHYWAVTGWRFREKAGTGSRKFT